MLTGPSIASYALDCRTRISLPTIRLISTNTAINRSLRKSSLRSQAIRPRSARPPGSTFRIHGRLDHQKINRDELGSRGGRNEGQITRSHLSGRLNHRSLDDAYRKKPSDQYLSSKYDYSSKPGGNREVRRAARFGRSRESPPSSSVERDDYGVEDEHIHTSPRTSPEHNQASRTLERTVSGRSLQDRQYERDHDQSRRSRINGRQQFDRDADVIGEHRVPLQIPYTTPASEFLYGTSVVVAALRSARRKLYKLYIYDGENREHRDQDSQIRKLAKSQNLTVKQGKGEWLRLMDKMSQGRPHNGYILEASPLPRLPVTALQRVRKPNTAFTLSLDHQSREDENINGTDPAIKYNSSFPRFPFVLFLDGILDPGNLGAILRTAYFLGVDAVAVSNRNSAPFSPVALKSSAGASEDLPLLSVSQPSAFIDQSKANGWRIYAAVAPSGLNSSSGSPRRPTRNTTATLGYPLRNDPCVLILGGEGEGLRWNVQRKADQEIGIEGERLGQGGVDSLNVSVAAGLLCDAFLRKPASPRREDGPLGSNGSISSGIDDRLF